MDPLDTLMEARQTYTAFADGRRVLGSGPDLQAVLQSARQAMAETTFNSAVVFDDATGKMTEIEPDGDIEATAERLLRLSGREPKRSGPGRPKLGVVSREVSLLPRHWDWLNEQPGGASAALRRLVEAAQKQNRARDLARQAMVAINGFMWMMAGNERGYEDASRALFAERYEDMDRIVDENDWPRDIADHLKRLTATARRLHALAQAEEAAT